MTTETRVTQCRLYGLGHRASAFESRCSDRARRPISSRGQDPADIEASKQLRGLRNRLRSRGLEVCTRAGDVDCLTGFQAEDVYATDYDERGDGRTSSSRMTTAC